MRESYQISITNYIESHVQWQYLLKPGDEQVDEENEDDEEKDKHR